MAIWGSLIKYWPYNLSLTLDNYDFAKFDSNGWDSYWNSVRMALGAAVFGTVLMFTGAWLNEKTRGFGMMQRTRAFDSFEDAEAGYEKRPSAWVEPLDDWGRGEVHLVKSGSLANDGKVIEDARSYQ